MVAAAPYAITDDKIFLVHFLRLVNDREVSSSDDVADKVVHGRRFPTVTVVADCRWSDGVENAVHPWAERNTHSITASTELFMRVILFIGR
jgi:hypothetical protein